MEKIGGWEIEITTNMTARGLLRLPLPRLPLGLGNLAWGHLNCRDFVGSRGHLVPFAGGKVELLVGQNFDLHAWA